MDSEHTRALKHAAPTEGTRRGRRGGRRQLQRQIEAVERQLQTHPKLGRTRAGLEIELAELCAKREALTPREGVREEIAGSQLRSRQTMLQKRPTARPADQRSVENLAVTIASRKGPAQSRRKSD